MSTLRQKIVARKISENLRNKKMKPMGKILLESGYAENSSKRPSDVTNSAGFKEETRPFVERLKKVRDQALAEIDRRGDNLTKEQYNHLTEGIDKFSKLTELLEGRPTERLEFPGWTPAELKQYADTGTRPERFSQSESEA